MNTCFFLSLDQITKKYIGFFIPESGEARIHAQTFYDYLKKINAVHSLLGLSLDGPNHNVGPDNGFLRQVELLIGRALQWLICLFHMLELLFRALFSVIDGIASGPDSYTGPIGKKHTKENITCKY